MSSAPSPWALARYDEIVNRALARGRSDGLDIMLALDAARLDGAERMREAAASWLRADATKRASESTSARPDYAAIALRRAASEMLALDPARVLAGED